ncbi:MAG: hypothetical protein E7232_13745 [Lachnospiraceae bacterium]|nr:hypothetical protein [Lachnospiraceae bacterium]
MNDKNKLTWVKNNFISKEFYAPFIIEKDIDYYEELSQKLKSFYDRAAEVGADEESLGMAKIDDAEYSNIVSNKRMWKNIQIRIHTFASSYDGL